MPIYEYKCKKCSEMQERLLPVAKRNSLHKCPECGAPKGLELIISETIYHDTYSPMHPRRGRGVGGQGRIDPGRGMDMGRNLQ